jgi:hypothetical protein
VNRSRARVLPSLTLLAPLLALGSLPALADSRAQGSLDLGDSRWTAVDVIAYKSGEDIEVVFSDQSFDREAMAADGRIDAFDILSHRGSTMTLTLSGGEPAMCLHTQSRSEDGMVSGSLCQSEFPAAIAIETPGPDRVAGQMDWQGEDGRFVKLDFEAAVFSETDLRADAEPLPADGGAPGQAVLAHFAALEAGDYEALKALSHPEARAMMEQSEADGDHLEILEFLREISPRNLVITGGSVFGDHAEVSFEAEDEGRPVRGTADVVLEDGEWYFQGTTIRD